MRRIFAIALLAVLLGAPPALSQQTPDGVDQKALNIFKACIGTWVKLEQTGFLSSYDLSHDPPIFVVDESQWRRMEFKLKVTFGPLTRCIAGTRPGWAETEFRSNLTNRLLGKLEGGELKESE